MPSIVLGTGLVLGYWEQDIIPELKKVSLVGKTDL